MEQQYFKWVPWVSLISHKYRNTLHYSAVLTSSQPLSSISSWSTITNPEELDTLCGFCFFVISFLTITTYLIPCQLCLALLNISHCHLPWAFWNPSSWNTFTWKRFWENHFSLTSENCLKWMSSPPPVLRHQKCVRRKTALAPPCYFQLFLLVCLFVCLFLDSQPLSSISKRPSRC